MEKDFRAWYRDRTGSPWPGRKYEDAFVVQVRAFEAMADWMDLLAGNEIGPYRAKRPEDLED